MSDRQAGVRRGIVLGAGGTLGAAWMIARLRAIEQTYGFDAREVELLLGSSAGSVITSLLAHGVSVSELLDHQHGTAADENPLAAVGFDYDTTVGGPLPERPPLRLGSMRLLGHVLRRPRHLGALTAVAAVLPPGRGSLAGLRAVVDHAARGRDGWPPSLRVVAMDYRTGARVVFGSSEAPLATAADAVVASCSIPGWFAPARVAGRSYVDAGFRFVTSADLAAAYGLDEVFVLAPLASFLEEPLPGYRFARVELRWRHYLARRLRAEVAELDRAGLRTVLLMPSPAERVAMGANLMDTRRRQAVLAATLAEIESPGAGRATPDRLAVDRLTGPSSGS